MNVISITNLTAPELAVFRDLSESQLKHYFEPENGLFLAESPNVLERALAFGCRPLSVLSEAAKVDAVLSLLGKYGADAPVYTAPNEELKKITGFPLTRGVIGAMFRPLPEDPLRLLREATRIAVLESVVNPTNIGAIFRSAAALNMDAVLLTPDCCDPLSKRAVRVSMGTVFQIPWAFLYEKQEDWLRNGAALLHENGYKTVAMALKEDSLNINDPRLKSEPKLAVILGTEGDGLKDTTMAGCDYTVCIPMGHGVDSLNVAAAGAVAFWELGHN